MLFLWLLSLSLFSMFWSFLSFLLLPLWRTKRWRADGTFSIKGIKEVLVEVTLPQQRALQKQVFFAQKAKTLISKSNLEVLAFLLEILQGIPYLRSFVFGRLVFLVISVFFSRKVCFFFIVNALYKFNCIVYKEKVRKI